MRWLGRDADHAALPRVSRLGAAVIAALAFGAVLTAGTSVTVWSLRGNLRADVARQLEAAQSLLRGVDAELQTAALIRLGPTCDAARGALIRASLESAVSRQLLLALPAHSALCGPMQDIAAPVQSAYATYSLGQGAARDRPERLRLLPIFDAEPGLLAIRGRGLGQAVISQVELRPLSLSLAGIQDPLVGWQQLGLIESTESVAADSGPPVSSEVRLLGRASPEGAALTEREVGNEYPVVVTASVSWAGLISALLPNLLPSAALAAALALLLILRINTRLAQRASPERRLRGAVRRRQFEPVIQPIVDAVSGRCLGGEVLMRWEHPVRGLVPPVEFIGLAEQSGLIVPMSEILMRKARDRLAPTLKSLPDLYFSFNITASQLMDPRFPDQLDQLFDESSLPAKNVVLEIIERDAVDSQISAGLKQLRQRGYRIAIDDFGTGQSSLALLTRIECDRLKIDREFVRAIDEATINRPVLDAIIDLSRRMNLPAIAEGVETQAQRAYLSSQGVAALQGYLIAKPMPISDFLVWLDDNDQWVRSADEAQRLGQVHALGQAHAN